MSRSVSSGMKVKKYSQNFFLVILDTFELEMHNRFKYALNFKVEMSRLITINQTVDYMAWGFRSFMRGQGSIYSSENHIPPPLIVK